MRAADDSWRAIAPRPSPPIVLDLVLAADGAVRAFAGQCWSSANPGKRFQLQSFGGTVEGERTFGRYTIPARLKAGNHYGTDDYLPFFQADIIRAAYR